MKLTSRVSVLQLAHRAVQETTVRKLSEVSNDGMAVLDSL